MLPTNVLMTYSTYHISSSRESCPGSQDAYRLQFLQSIATARSKLSFLKIQKVSLLRTKITFCRGAWGEKRGKAYHFNPGVDLQCGGRERAPLPAGRGNMPCECRGHAAPCNATPCQAPTLRANRSSKKNKKIEARGRRAVIHSFYLNTEGLMTSLGVPSNSRPSPSPLV